MYTHVYTCIHMYTHAYTWTKNGCIHVNTHAYTCIHMYTHVYTLYTHAYTWKKNGCMHTYTHVCTCIHMYTHVHTLYTHAYTWKKNRCIHTYTHFQHKSTHESIHTPIHRNTHIRTYRCIYTCVSKASSHMDQSIHPYIEIDTYVQTKIHTCIQRCIQSKACPMRAHMDQSIHPYIEIDTYKQRYIQSKAFPMSNNICMCVMQRHTQTSTRTHDRCSTISHKILHLASKKIMLLAHKVAEFRTLLRSTMHVVPLSTAPCVRGTWCLAKLSWAPYMPDVRPVTLSMVLHHDPIASLRLLNSGRSFFGTQLGFAREIELCGFSGRVAHSVSASRTFAASPTAPWRQGDQDERQLALMCVCFGKTTYLFILHGKWQDDGLGGGHWQPWILCGCKLATCPLCKPHLVNE